MMYYKFIQTDTGFKYLKLIVFLFFEIRFEWRLAIKFQHMGKKRVGQDYWLIKRNKN